MDSGQAQHQKADPEVATLGGGCFWCLEAVYDQVQGVTDVVSGYSGGTVPQPTYQQGADVGPQYRSVIFYHNEEQKDTAEAVIAELEADHI